MTKARTLADFISDGNPLADGTISVSEVSGAAPLASPDFTGTVTLGDDVELHLGDSDDLKIYHSPDVGNYITGSGTYGNININAHAVKITDNGSNVVADFSEDGSSARLYSAGSGVKLATTTTGVDVTGTVTSDAVDLSAISSTITDTAVDVFVYDTSKDSDGGAWRKRTQHTSWYNEAASATRGSRKEFPSVAVIVAESNQVTIYDGDDPDMPMWRVFNRDTNTPDTGRAWWRNASSFVVSSVAMKNGSLVFGVTVTSGTSNTTAGLLTADFIGDELRRKSSASTNSVRGVPVAESNNNPVLQLVTSDPIISSIINDIAMTVLPNAPVDPATGLPVPTIAVATNGGISVIKDDGTVVDIAYASYTVSNDVYFIGEGIFASFDNAVANNRYGKVWNTIPSSDLVSGGTSYNSANGEDANYSAAAITGYAAVQLRIGKTSVIDSVGLDFALPQGVSRVVPNAESPADGMFSLIASDYSTGYQVGDIKLATLSDTDATNVTGAELVTNGDFATDTDWTKGTGWTISGNEAVATSAAQNAAIVSTTFTTVVGKQYAASYEITGYTSGSVRAVVRGAGTLLVGSVKSAIGVYEDYFVADSTSTTIELQIRGISSSTLTADNVSVRIAEEDRSVNGNGLQVFGTVTKTAVATGADLVAYSGFSASNYLEQPANTDLDFGTGDFCAMGWFKSNTGSGLNEPLFFRGLTDTNSYAMIEPYIRADGKVDVLTRNAAEGTSVFTTTTNILTQSWVQWCMVRRSGVMYFYVNGVLSGSAANTRNVTPSTSAKKILRIGAAQGLNKPIPGSIALFRISATAPSPEQIAKIYNDEKHLFQAGAQATLYGDEDAVTALAYDDTTELLHVGTSEGRSVFQGLRRVDNTTDAVGAAISASNGLVVEE